MATQINVYLVGNRLHVDATFAVDSDLDGVFETPTEPTTVILRWENLDTGTVLKWKHAPATPDVLPTGVNATLTNPDVGVWAIEFDCDTPGIMVVRAEGTGACKAAGEKKFRIADSALSSTALVDTP